jgi:hypothetical protein
MSTLNKPERQNDKIQAGLRILARIIAREVISNELAEMNGYAYNSTSKNTSVKVALVNGVTG